MCDVNSRIHWIIACCMLVAAFHFGSSDLTWHGVVVAQDTTPCPSSPALVTPGLLLLAGPSPQQPQSRVATAHPHKLHGHLLCALVLCTAYDLARVLTR